MLRNPDLLKYSIIPVGANLKPKMALSFLERFKYVKT